MGYSKRIWGMLALFLLLGSRSALATITFKQPAFTFKASLNKQWIVDLTSLLKDPTTTVTNWQLSDNTPSWITVDAPNHVLTGTLPNANLQTITFTLTARNSDTDTASAQITLNVVAPPAWTFNDVDLGIQNQGLAFTHDLKQDIKDNPTGGPITFSSDNLPTWMNLTADGILTGTPARKDVGLYKGIHFSAQGEGGTANAVGHGQVLITIQPPKWTANPVTLPDVNEDSNFSADISTFVLNSEGTPLTFSLTAPIPPAWLHITSTGTLYGIPGASDVRVLSTEVTVQTTINDVPYSAKTIVSFTVKHVDHPPTWLANPLQLPPAQAQVAYSQGLSQSATDPDVGDTLTFALVSGPSWAAVSPQGTLSGTPANTNQGNNSFVVSVTDQAGKVATTTVLINVKKAVQPPVWNTHPVMLANGAEDKAYTVDLTQFATDPDGNRLYFSLISGPSWLSVSENGILSGTPSATNVGPHKLVIQVSDHITAGGDITALFVQIDHTNHAPEWTLNPIVISTPEEKAFTANLSVYANDKDPGDKAKLVYSAISGPAWAQLSATGAFNGTPQMANEGANNYIVRVADSSGATADVQVIVTVTHVNHAPVWTQNPIVLPNAKEDSPYTASIAALATDVDKDSLIFAKISGPDWILLTSDGKIQGTPAFADVGLKPMVVEVRDPSNAFATTTVNITVDKINHAPYWRQNPLVLGNVPEDQVFNFNLTPYAADRDGDKLTFSKVSGPDWAVVNATGIVTGVPQKKDVASFVLTLRVSDGTLTADVQATGTVTPTSHPPVIATPGPTYTLKERQTFQASLSSFITDPDGNTVTCSLLDTASWISLSSDCNLLAAPQHANIGEHTFQFTVSDGTLSTNGNIKITVVADPVPPTCQDPIHLVAKTNEPFSDSVASGCKDPNGATLTYSKQTGKDWLTVGPQGDLSGTPKDADFGKETFVVAACNDKTCANANVVIDVQYGTKVDTVQIDAPVPNASAEQLWVIDNSSASTRFIRELKAHIQTFFSAMASANIHYSSLMISTDSPAFNGSPVLIANQSPVMNWTEEDVANDFRNRIDMIYSGGQCSNCDNSPLWSMFQFYAQAPTLSELYKKLYFLPNEPMDALIVTNQLDHAKRFTQGSQQAGYSAQDYATAFLNYHQALNEPYRISAIDPQCHGFVEGSEFNDGDNPYKAVVEKTNGKYYPLKCKFDMAAVLSDYAKTVIFRANVFAKNRIKLEKTPKDAGTVKVILGPDLLPGNTGSDKDLWSYDAATNEVVIHWNAVDFGTLTPGENLIVEYRIS